MSDLEVYRILETFDALNEGSADRIHARVEARKSQCDVEEGTTKVQSMGNKVVVSKDGNKTEFDDAETAAAMMGTDDENQFATENKEDDLPDNQKPYPDELDKETVIHGDWNSKNNKDDKEKVEEGFGDYDDFNANGIDDEDEGIEWSTFDPNNPEHRKRLQAGTPVVLDPSICSDPDGDRTAIFKDRSPSGHFATVVRNIDGKEINVHLSDAQLDVIIAQGNIGSNF
jgi:hypothetical protein